MAAPLLNTSCLVKVLVSSNFKLLRTFLVSNVSHYSPGIDFNHRSNDARGLRDPNIDWRLTVANKCNFASATASACAGDIGGLDKSSTSNDRKPPRDRTVLGIETSCDDTGIAVVNERGHILGEALVNQTKTHLQFGGIIPPVARDLHQEHIEETTRLALERANMTLQGISAIAVTVKPGMALSLGVGLNHAQRLVQESGKPMIPIHHMEAHALTVRMVERVEFPYLVLLASGGHCLLAVARGIDDFLLIGQSYDDSPGEALDKTARRLGLKNIPECSSLPGGAAIELLAKNGDPRMFQFTEPMLKIANCNFSFAGLKEHARQTIEKEEIRLGVTAGSVLPNVSDMCASFQFAIWHHMARRLQRCLLFCEMKNLLPEKKTLVISGGVASNQFIRQSMESVCQPFNCSVVCPPPSLCTDNGIMIAWNGIEKLKENKDLLTPDQAQQVQFTPKCPLGDDISDEVSRCTIKMPKLKGLRALL